MWYKIRFCFSIILVLLSSALYAQEIKGKIVDATDGKPIADANVYLNGTYQGTSSNKEGNFIIHSPEKNIPLIISFVGYETQTVSNYSGKELLVALKKRANVLREVTIGNDYRDEAMKIFLREFIGAPEKDCFIANPDDISFIYHRNKGELNASADRPLSIVNKKLGYKITYFLANFKHTRDETDYQGNYFFTEDTAGLDVKEKKHILSERNDVYFGSRMNFIRAVWANDLNKQNFYVFDHVNHPIPYDSLVVKYGNNKYMRLKSTMQVEYWNFRSTIEANNASMGIFIAANGFFDTNVIWTGVLGDQRIGDMLPFEFEPVKAYELR